MSEGRLFHFGGLKMTVNCWTLIPFRGCVSIPSPAHGGWTLYMAAQSSRKLREGQPGFSYPSLGSPRMFFHHVLLASEAFLGEKWSPSCKHAYGVRPIPQGCDFVLNGRGSEGSVSVFNPALRPSRLIQRINYDLHKGPWVLVHIRKAILPLGRFSYLASGGWAGT